MTQLKKTSGSLPSRYFLATLEVLAGMLQSRNDTPGITIEEHDQFLTLKKRLSLLVSKSLHDSDSNTALAFATSQLVLIHESIDRFFTQSNRELKSNSKQLEELWNQNNHVTRWAPSSIASRCDFAVPPDADTTSHFADSDLKVARTEFEQWIKDYSVIRERSDSTRASILKNAEEVVENLGRPFGKKERPAARLGVDPNFVSDTEEDDEQPLEGLQHEISRFGINIGDMGLDPGLSFLVQVSHDLTPNDVSLPANDIRQLSDLCKKLHGTIEKFQQILSQVHQASALHSLLTPLATDSGWIDDALKSVSDRIDERDEHKAQLQEIVATAKRGDVESAERSLQSLERQFDLPYGHADQAIVEQRALQQQRQLDQETLQQKKRLKEIATSARRGDVDSAEESLKGIPRRFELPYADVDRIIVEQKAMLTRTRGLFQDVEDEYDKLEGKRTGTTSGKVLDWLGAGFDESELEQALINACQFVRTLKWDRNSEYMQHVLDMIKTAEPRCEYCGILLRWVPAKPSVDEAVGKLKPQQIPAEEAAFNALCAIAASDGSFCAEEKRVVRRICDRANLNRSAEEVALGIKAWLQSARSSGLTTTLAQSVVDIENVKDTPLAKILPKALSLVADADDERDGREEVFLKRVLKRLS